MAKGKIFVRSDIGIEVKAQTEQGTYVDPDQILCVERGKLDEPKIEVNGDTVTCTTGTRISFLEQVDGSKVTFAIEAALPVGSKMGGLKDLIAACGVSVGDDGSGNPTFEPILDGVLPVSAEFTEKRRTTKVRDAYGNVTASFTSGKMVYIKCEMSGVLEEDPTELAAADADNAIPKNILSPDTDIVWMARKCGVDMGGTTLYLTEASFDNGVSSNDVDTACGVLPTMEYLDPSLSLSFRETEENEASFQALKNGTEFAVTIPLYKKDGSDAGSFTASKCVAVEPDDRSDDNGYRAATRKFQLRETSGNDNYLATVKG